MQTKCVSTCTGIPVPSALSRLPAPPEQPESDGQPPHLSSAAGGETGHQGRASLPQSKMAGGEGGRVR